MQCLNNRPNYRPEKEKDQESKTLDKDRTDDLKILKNICLQKLKNIYIKFFLKEYIFT